MTSVERFPNAPITEAVLELRVKLPQEVDVARLATFQETLKEEYPLKRDRVSWETGFQFKSEHPPEIVGQSVKSTGYLLTSADGKQVVQARLDAFALSRLKPYDCWETFRDEARTLWKRYVEIASPEAITKVSLRYINRIEIPLPLKDFKEYILTIPEIAPGLPQALAGFFMRLIMPEPETGALAIVMQTIGPNEEGKSVLPLIFDIDVSREASFDVDSEEAWIALEKLREFKNRIFFESITEKAKEIFR